MQLVTTVKRIALWWGLGIVFVLMGMQNAACIMVDPGVPFIGEPTEACPPLWPFVTAHFTGAIGWGGIYAAVTLAVWYAWTSSAIAKR
jgi:hypothetical protein